jgi:acetoacetate decarboxylase
LNVRLVKSSDEIAAIQSLYTRAHFLGLRQLTVHFETTPQAVRDLLPPPLEPAPEPVGVAWVGEVGNSNCMGSFEGGGVYLRARYEDVIGYYCVAAPRSTTDSVIIGREVFGEPAKLAKVVFEEQEEHVWGHCERHEIRYFSVRGRREEPAPAGRQEFSSFLFKFLPRGDGAGFDCAPRLVHVTSNYNITTAEHGRGELVFRESPHDPLDDIPVQQVVDSVYIEGQMYSTSRVLCEVDADAFLPYAFNRTDAMELLAENTVMHGQASRQTTDGRGQWRKVGE